MTQTTAKNRLPYPVGTDRVRDGDDAIRALAEAVDVRLAPRAAAYAVTVDTPISPSIQALGAPLTVPDAPSGTYRMTLCAQVSAASATVIRLHPFRAGVSDGEALAASLAVGAITWVNVSRLVSHTGGDLTLSWAVALDAGAGTAFRRTIAAMEWVGP